MFSNLELGFSVLFSERLFRCLGAGIRLAISINIVRDASDRVSVAEPIPSCDSYVRASTLLSSVGAAR